MSAPYPGRFHRGQRSPAVEAVARGLIRAGYLKPGIIVFNALPSRFKQTWGVRKRRALLQFKKKHGLPKDSIYGEKTHAKLSRYFDAKAKRLLNEATKPKPEEVHWQKLLAGMKLLDKNTRGYVYGAGHGTPLDQQDPDDAYDCSSSSSKVLRMGGMFPHEYAMVSGDLATQWGEPGKGKYFTVYAHSGHAWIRLHKSRWWRFDTSPYGWRDSNRRGPRLRLLPRPTWGFTARHWPGM